MTKEHQLKLVSGLNDWVWQVCIRATLQRHSVEDALRITKER